MSACQNVDLPRNQSNLPNILDTCPSFNLWPSFILPSSHTIMHVHIRSYYIISLITYIKKCRPIWVISSKNDFCGSTFLTSTKLIKQILKCPVGTLDLGLLRRCGVDGGVAGGTFAPGTPHSKEVAFWNVDGIWLGKTDNLNRPPWKKKEMQLLAHDLFFVQFWEVSRFFGGLILGWYSFL